MITNPELLWKWENDPNVREKRCRHCNEPMLYGRAAAINYQNEIYHDHCLITFLTEYHTNNTKQATITTQPETLDWTHLIP